MPTNGLSFFPGPLAPGAVNCSYRTGVSVEKVPLVDLGILAKSAFSFKLTDPVTIKM
jgi:hypothetical protein